MTRVGMILAAGFGTRLRPLTHELPKPLVPVGDRTMLAHAADNLRAVGVTRVVLNTHHLADAYDAEALAEALAMEVVIEHEPRIRGTAGGIAGVRRHLGEGPAIIHNGDILADLDMAALLATHERSRAETTLALFGDEPAGDGPVGLDEGGAIVRLRDRSFGAESRSAHFAGVYVVSEALRRRLPDEGCMIGDVCIPALEQGRAIAAAPVVRAYTDVGTPRRYLDANLRWLRKRELPAFVASDAHVAPRIQVAESIIGAGARVEGQGRIVRSVVWPGARATAPLEDAIITTAGKVVQEIAPDAQ